MHLADWHLWLVNPCPSVILPERTGQAKRRLSRHWHSRGLLWRHTASSLWKNRETSNFNLLKILARWKRHWPTWRSLAPWGFTVIEWQFRLSLVDWLFADLNRFPSTFFLLICNFLQVCRPASVWCTLHFVSLSVTEGGIGVGEGGLQVSRMWRDKVMIGQIWAKGNAEENNYVLSTSVSKRNNDGNWYLSFKVSAAMWLILLVFVWRAAVSQPLNLEVTLEEFE